MKINKLKSINKHITPLLLSGVMAVSLASCNKETSVTRGIKKTDQSTYSNSYKSTEPTMSSTENPTEQVLPSEDLEKYRMDNMVVHSDSTANQMFQSYVDEFYVEYKDSELFGIDAAKAKYSEIPELSISSSNVIDGNTINKDKLFSLVKQNNEKFLLVDKTKKYKDIDDSQLKKVIEVVCGQLETLLKSEANVDINILDNTLSNLKIFETSGFGIAYVNQEEPILGISFNSIEKLQKNKNNTNIDVFDKIVAHEADHLAQVAYYNNDQINYNMGALYSFSDLDINPLYWEWYVEGTAEALNLDGLDDEPFNYSDDVKSLQTLTLSTIADSDNEIYTINDLSLQRDIDEIYDYFNADTDQKKDEIIKMMYSYNIIYTNGKEFSDKYKATKGDISLTQLDDYRDELRGSIGTTLTKVFYSNLADKVTTDGMNINDLFFLMRVYETEMCRLTDYDNEYKKDKTKAFLNNYSAIQNNFFDLISGAVGKDSDEIKKAYTLYSEEYCDTAKHTSVTNYSITDNVDSLSEDKNEFVRHLAKTRIFHAYKNINN